VAKARIMIVEDELIIGRDVKISLERMDYTVTSVATSAEQALERAERDRPDLILMDIVLPGQMDGVGAAEEIRSRWGIPVVFLTAYADEKTLERAKMSEPFGYLLKPFQARELRAVIEMALHKAEMEERLRASEARYRAVVEDQTELICRFELPEARLTFVNQAYCRFFDRRPEDLVGQSFMPLIPEEDRGRDQKLLAALSLENPVVTIEHRVIKPDGEMAWVQWTNRAFFDRQGRIIECQGVGRDVTARKRAEEERERLLAELQEALGRVRKLSGLLPICSSCKKIRDDQGYWRQIEAYIRDHSEAEFSHSICPECAKKLYPEFYKDK